MPVLSQMREMSKKNPLCIGGDILKHGKKPTMAQKMRILSLKLNPANWLIVKDCRQCFEVVHRVSGKSRKLGA